MEKDDGSFDEYRKRTIQQNKSMHLWCDMVARCLNDAGVGHKAVYQVRELDVPWCMDTVKAELFRPICNAITAGESTADAHTVDYSRVRDVLTKHLGENFGVVLPAWPNRFGDG
jgi:hypothetical protein